MNVHAKRSAVAAIACAVAWLSFVLLIPAMLATSVDLARPAAPQRQSSSTRCACRISTSKSSGAALQRRQKFSKAERLQHELAEAESRDRAAQATGSSLRGHRGESSGARRCPALPVASRRSAGRFRAARRHGCRPRDVIPFAVACVPARSACFRQRRSAGADGNAPRGGRADPPFSLRRSESVAKAGARTRSAASPGLANHSVVLDRADAAFPHPELSPLMLRRLADARSSRTDQTLWQSLCAG